MKRFAALDALRGLAAVSVLFGHIHDVFFSRHTLLDLTPLYLFWAGGPAVVLFFVLSGLVLVRRTQVGPPQAWSTFWLGRFFRIGVPYLFVTGCCVVLAQWCAAQGWVSGRAYRWPAVIDWSVVAGHVGMVGDFNTNVFDDALWSLVHELRFALVFPLFWWAFTRWRSWIFGLAFGAASLLSAAWVTAFGDPSQGYKTAFVYTTHYLLLFGMGALLLRHLDAASAQLMRWRPGQRRFLLAASLLIYVYARMVYLVPQKWGFADVAVFNAFVADAMVGVAACVLMLAALNLPTWQRVLCMRPLQYLGQVSFSLYLVHIPVLKTVLALLPEAPLWVPVLCALPLIALFTHVFHHGVERPAQQTGRDLSRRWEAWRVRRQATAVVAPGWALDEDESALAASERIGQSKATDDRGS